VTPTVIIRTGAAVGRRHVHELESVKVGEFGTRWHVTACGKRIRRLGMLNSPVTCRSCLRAPQCRKDQS
jgi:hypothetical protein